jgi:TMEM175 potassium channel family protein
MATNRLEAFSDGVIAVAITLLVLGITVPQPPQPDLATTLASRWPEYAAYVVSFLTIGIIWINHHVMIGRLRGTDHSILILNLLLLMSIGVLPFATNLMATYLRAPRGESVAAAVYSGAFTLMAILFALLNRHILLNRRHLLRHELSEQEGRQILVRSVSGVGPYLVATALAFVSPYITLAMCGALAFYYALPIASGINRSAA